MEEMTTADHNKFLEMIAEIIALKAKTPEDVIEIVLNPQIKA